MRITTVKVKRYTTLNTTAEIRPAFWWGSFIITRRSLTAISRRDSRSKTWEWFVSALVMLGCFSSSLLLLAIKAHTAALVSSFDKVGRDNVFLVAPQFSLAFFLLLPHPIFFSLSLLTHWIQVTWYRNFCSYHLLLQQSCLPCGSFLPCTSRFTSTSVQIQIIHVVADRALHHVVRLSRLLLLSLLVFEFIKCSVSSFSVYHHRFGKLSWFWEATGLTHVTVKMTFDPCIWNIIALLFYPENWCEILLWLVQVKVGLLWPWSTIIKSDHLESKQKAVTKFWWSHHVRLVEFMSKTCVISYKDAVLAAHCRLWGEHLSYFSNN